MAATTGVGAALAAAGAAEAKSQPVLRPRQPGQLSEGRIDFHQHIMPPGYAEWAMSRAKPTFPPPKWSMEAAISANDALGNQGAYLSLSSPGVQFGDNVEARDHARRYNEFTAKVSSDRPDRFGWFATLTLPDVEGSIAEAVYALDVLKADGVVVMANSWGGVYLGDPKFDPLMAELNKRKTIMFVHPTDLWNDVHMEVAPPALADFLLDTTRAAINMAKHSVPTRYPDVKIILSHGAGFIPYHAQRLSVVANPGGFGGGPSAAIPQPGSPPPPNLGLLELQKFYFDLTSAMTPYAMPSILAFAKPTNILTGFDWPHAGMTGVLAARGFDAMPLADDVRAAITRENGLRLNNRFAKKT